MKNKRWYVAEISYFDGNPIHRSIVECINEKPIMVKIIQSDGCERIRIEDLKHFKIVSEIEDMRIKWI